MSIIDRLLKRFGYIGTMELAQTLKAQELQGDHGRYPMALAAEMAWRMPEPEIFAHQADLYRKLSWINSAVGIKANAGASVPFRVKRRRGEETTEIANHPFEMRLEQPNPLQSKAEFFETAFSFFSLTKNCYIWLNREQPTDIPDELWIVPPNEITPEPDGNLFLKGYTYQPSNSAAMLLPPWQIVHVKGFNPHNPFLGLSPIEAVARQAYGDLGKTEREAKMFNEQNGAPPGLLTFADNYQDDEWSQLNKDLDNASKKMRRFLTIRNTKQGGVNWVQTAMSNTDMQYLESRRFTKEEIYDVFAPGLASMLAVNATEANSKSGKATFAEYAIWPMLDAFAQKLTAAILPAYGLKLIGMFDDPRVKERVLDMQEMQEYAKTHTILEVRTKYYQDKPLGDERDNLLPAQITAQSGVPTPPAPKPEPPQPEAQPMQDDAQNVESDGQAEPDYDEMAMEMKRWKRVARKALKAGKSANVDFVTAIIPTEQQAQIRERLASVKTNAEVDGAFVFETVDPVIALANELRLMREALA